MEVYDHDRSLGHRFVAITGRTDQCQLCGCTVSDATNYPGKDGGRFDQTCTQAEWKCDDCGQMHPKGAAMYGFPDVICGNCYLPPKLPNETEPTP